MFDVEFSNDDNVSDRNSGGTSGDSGNTSGNDVTNFEVNEIMFSDYIVCSISLWHKRLAHISIKNIEKKCKLRV